MWKLVKAELSNRSAVINFFIKLIGAAVLLSVLLNAVTFIFNESLNPLDPIKGPLISLSGVALLILAWGHQEHMNYSELFEKRVRLFSLLPLKQDHIAFARLLAPVALFCVLFVVISVAFLNFYYYNFYIEEDNFPLIKLFISAFLIGLTLVAFEKLHSEIYGITIATPILFLFVAMCVVMGKMNIAFPFTGMNYQQLLFTPGYQVQYIQINIIISLVVVFYWAVNWISYVRRRSYLR